MSLPGAEKGKDSLLVRIRKIVSLGTGIGCMWLQQRGIAVSIMIAMQFVHLSYQPLL